MTNDIEEKETILFGPLRGASGKIASELIDEGTIEDLMPPQKTYQEIRRKEIRRALANLIRGVSLSRAHGKQIKVAVPLKKIRNNKGDWEKVSYRGIKKVIKVLRESGQIGKERGKPFWETSSTWKYENHQDWNKGKVTRIWATAELEDRIEKWLSTNTDVGADVQLLVEEETVVMKDNDGGYIDTVNSAKANEMKETVQDVNENLKRESVTLELPVGACISSLSLSSSSFHSYLSTSTGNTSPQRLQTAFREALHDVVKTKIPQAWMWNYRLEDGHLKYEVPDTALYYNRKFVRGSWNCGGRFYASIQNIPSEWRQYLRFNGKETTEIDFDGLHFRMLYAKEGKTYSGDPYQTDCNLLEDFQRTVNKLVANVLINSKNSQQAYSCLKNGINWKEKVGFRIPNEAFKPIVNALRDRHEEIKEYFHSDTGIRLQKEDSDLAYDIMTKTGAVGIHDGFIIEAKKEDKLRRVMKRAFKEEYGIEIEVSEE